jgi:hypothetical protein
MTRFKIIDVVEIEIAPVAAGEREAKILAMIASSTITRARVESLNVETRAYQIVLEGILEPEEESCEAAQPAGI